MIVYLVKGHTGEYDDRSEWIAKAFLLEEKADDMKGGLNILLEKSGNGMSYEERDLLEAIIRETLDPRCSIDYTGTYYTIEEVEVQE
jgi:hypothetical protein